MAIKNLFKTQKQKLVVHILYLWNWAKISFCKIIYWLILFDWCFICHVCLGKESSLLLSKSFGISYRMWIFDHLNSTDLNNFSQQISLDTKMFELQEIYFVNSYTTNEVSKDFPNAMYASLLPSWKVPGAKLWISSRHKNLI